MNNAIPLLIAIPFIIFIAPYVAKLIKIPNVCVEIILGMVLCFVLSILDIPRYNYLLNIAAQGGFIFLMFLAGLEVKFQNILYMEKSLIRPSLLYITLIYAFSLLFIYIFSLPFIVIVLLPLISIGIIATLSKEYGSDTPWLKMAFIVGTVAEIVSIIQFSLVSQGFINGFGLDILTHLVYLIIFILGTILLFKAISVIFWWYPSIKEHLTPSNDHQEKDIRLSMIILFGLVALMLYLDLEVALGAFIAGMFIRAFFLETHIKDTDLLQKLEGFGFGFLVPIFFVYTGLSFDITYLGNIDVIYLSLTIAFIMIASRVLAGFVFYKKLGLIQSLLLSVSHAMPLSLLIALLTIAFQSGNIDRYYYNAFILASLLEVIIATIGIKWLVMWLKK